MATEQVQKRIIKVLRLESRELSLDDLVERVRPNVASGRHEVVAAVVPLLYSRNVTLTPSRRFRIGS